jgi:hypothetical protein
MKWLRLLGQVAGVLFLFILLGRRTDAISEPQPHTNYL